MINVPGSTLAPTTAIPIDIVPVTLLVVSVVALIDPVNVALGVVPVMYLVVTV